MSIGMLEERIRADKKVEEVAEIISNLLDENSIDDDDVINVIKQTASSWIIVYKIQESGEFGIKFN